MAKTELARRFRIRCVGWCGGLQRNEFCSQSSLSRIRQQAGEMSVMEAIVEALLLLGCGLAGALSGTVIGFLAAMGVILILQYRDSPAGAGAVIYSVFLTVAGAVVGVVIGVVAGGILFPRGILPALAFALVLGVVVWWRIRRWGT
jgi:hypothetical protein